LKDTYQNYVPLQRVFNDAELDGEVFKRTAGVANLSDETTIKKLEGSLREIESPLESLIGRTMQVVSEVEKNRAAQSIISYRDVKGNPFGLRPIAKVSDAAKDKGTITAFVDGKKQVWEVDRHVAEASKNLNSHQMNIVTQALAVPVRVARLGITGIAPGFVAKNIVRDQMSAFIMSDKGLQSSVANPVVWLRGLSGAMNHGELFNRMMSDGALMTSFDLSRNQLAPNLRRINADRSTIGGKVFTAKRPQDWLRAVEDTMSRFEQATRMQQYLGAYEDAIKRGVDEKTARILGARAARENSVNFARRGEWGNALNAGWLYINAGIQGSRLLLRNLKNKPAKTSAKIAMTLSFPAAVATYWNMSDERRKEIYDDIPEWEKENYMIFVPPDATSTEDVWKLPLMPGLGEFTTMVRRPIEASYGDNPISFKEAASSLLRTVQPVDLEKPLSTLTPQAIKPSVQAGTNQNLFTGFDIVPRRLQDEAPADQVFREDQGDSRNTSGTAELIAGGLGTSPIQTEQFIKDSFGSVADNALNVSDRALNSVGVLDENQIGGRSPLESVVSGFKGSRGGE
jgi:hypothetical protein